MTKGQDCIGLEEKMALLFENARIELDAIDELAQEDKKKVVKDLAKCLEGMIRTDTICIEIVNQLHGKVSERFIRECLEDKYKQQQKMQNARKQKKKKQLKAQEHHENLAALPPLDQSEEEKQTDNKEIIITQNIDGSSIQEKEQKNPEPSPIGIASTRANASAVASKGQSKHDLAECFHCKEKDVVICELRQALSKQTTSITANQMYPHETKFTIPKQKYSDLQEAIQRSRNLITVVFDKSGVLEHVIDDI